MLERVHESHEKEPAPGGGVANLVIPAAARHRLEVAIGEAVERRDRHEEVRATVRQESRMFGQSRLAGALVSEEEERRATQRGIAEMRVVEEAVEEQARRFGTLLLG